MLIQSRRRCAGAFLLATWLMVFIAFCAEAQQNQNKNQNPNPNPKVPGACQGIQAGLGPCVGYLSAGNNQRAVAPACCQALANVASSSASCLCQLFYSNSPFGIPIDQSRVLVLPGLCNMNLPSAFQCQEVGGGGGGTALSPPVAVGNNGNNNSPPEIDIPSINGIPSVGSPDLNTPGSGTGTSGSNNGNILPGGTGTGTSTSVNGATLCGALGIPALIGVLVTGIFLTGWC